MSQIIHIHIGQCGTQIGLKYWESISQEHGIDPTGTFTGNSDIQLKGKNVCFEEITDNKYVPRAIFVDLDPASIDSVRGSSLGRLFSPDYMMHGQHGTGNNWAKGHYTDGAEITDRFQDLIDKQAEKCDSLEGFQLTYSMGGGSGSGMGSTAHRLLREKYVDQIVSTFPIFSSPKVSDAVVEPYNVVLGTMELFHSSDMVQVIDNGALYDIASRNLITRSPTYNDLNQIVGSAMSGVTNSFRFPGLLNSSLRKLATNLKVYTQLHFFTVSYAPLSSQYKKIESSEVHSLVDQLFDPQNVLCSVDPRKGIYLTAAANFMGELPTSEIEREMAERSRGFSCAYWIPNSFKLSYCDIPPSGFKNAGSLISNSTAVQEVFRREMERFTALFKRKAFLHWYTGEGVDEMEFTEAESITNDIIAEYNYHQDYYFDNPLTEDEEREGEEDI